MSCSDGNQSDGSRFEFLDDLEMDAPWSPHEDKIFESALADLEEVSGDCRAIGWAQIAMKLPGRTSGGAAEPLQGSRRRHRRDRARVLVPGAEFLGHSLPQLEGDLVSPGSQASDHSLSGLDSGFKSHGGHSGHAKNGEQPTSSASAAKDPKNPGQGKASEQERRKGIPWTEEEHRFVTPSVSSSLPQSRNSLQPSCWPDLLCTSKCESL